MTETVVSSATREVVIGFDRPFVIIGERINPTGRKMLAAEMAAGDFSRVEADARAQVDALHDVRARRDASGVRDALARVRQDAQTGVNVMPAIIAAVKAYASVGEITRELVDVFGRHREPIRF